MHELSLCGQIHRIVERAAAGRPVAVVHLQVGQLRQVVPDTLAYCWTLVAQETAVAGSTLQIESVPVTVSCRHCAQVSAIGNVLMLVCPACGSADLEIQTGEEFMITSLELAPGTAAQTSEV